MAGESNALGLIPGALDVFLGALTDQQVFQNLKTPDEPKQKPPTAKAIEGLKIRCLTMTYSHMGRPHTTIGDESFHC